MNLTYKPCVYIMVEHNPRFIEAMVFSMWTSENDRIRQKMKSMYGLFEKGYKIAQYAQLTYGEKVTLEQLKTSIIMITHGTDPRTVAKFVEDVQKDFSPCCKPQFVKQDVNCFLVRPNRPKTPNALIGEAYEKREKEK